MNDRRRGLGRGLGALIPAAPREQSDPRDVFFAPAHESAGSAGFTGNMRAPGSADHTDGPSDKQSAVASAVAPEDEPSELAASVLAQVPGATFAELPIDTIRPNPRQPRQVFDDDELTELAHSIREVGVLQPVVVRRENGFGAGAEQPLAGPAATYELVMGERRWRASREAGLKSIPAIIRSTDDDDLLRDALLENLHRSQLNALEEAAAYRQLLDDFDCTHENLAERIGRSRPQISNTLRLLKLPPLVQRRVAAGVLSAGHARALLGLDDAAAIERLAQRIVAEGLSVRSVEEIVVLGGHSDPVADTQRSRRAAVDPELASVSERLGERLETRVQVSMSRRRGRITVEFAGKDDLHRILDLLGAPARQPAP